MRRESENLRFGVELANTQLLGRETISSMAERLAQQDIPLLAGVNGSFGLRGDRIGRGGVIFNLHIQDWELVSIAPRRDWWGFPPPSPWGETSFGVTTDGEFLLDAVELNGLSTSTENRSKLIVSIRFVRPDATPCSTHRDSGCRPLHGGAMRLSSRDSNYRLQASIGAVLRLIRSIGGATA